MGESSEWEDGLLQGLPTLLASTSALELHSLESSALLLVLLVLVLLVGGGQGDSELLSSNLQPCQENGANAQELHCFAKLLLHFPILHGQNTLSDTMETFVTHVQEYGGAMKALDVPYRITIYKSDIYAQYPIYYLQSFNEKPHEVTISSPHCRDGNRERNPDCGWLYNNDGEKVKDSQGFCCMCNTKVNFPFWLRKSKSIRVNEDCNGTSLSRKLFSWRLPGAAHCLRASPKWYPTYMLGKPILSTSTRVVVQMMHSSDGQPYGLGEMSYQALDLNPQQSMQLHPKQAFKAHLEGDFEFNIQLPLLQDQYLSIPMEEGKSEKVVHVNQWLTLPKDYFTLDGKECDKIGVSSSTFKYQAKACEQPFQSCCRNQLNDFVQEDSQRMLAGEAPKYAFSRYGEAIVQERNNAIEPTTLNLHIDKEKASFLTIELEADDLQYYNERSTGKILKANVGQFETGTRRLLLQVEVVNMGIMKAYFKIKVAECTKKVEILPVEINTPLVPAIQSSFWIRLLIREEIDLFNSSTMSCKVIMFDNSQEISSKVALQFEVQLHELYNSQPPGSSPGLNSTTKHFTVFGYCFFWCTDNQSYIKPPPPPRQVDPCLWNCTSWYNGACFVANYCWDKLVTMIGIIAAIIIGGFAAFLVVQTGALSVILEYLGVVVSKSTKGAKRVGKKVKRAQRRRLRRRVRQRNRDRKEEDMEEFVDERLADEEEDAYEKLVLRVPRKERKKRRKKRIGGDNEDNEEEGKKGKKKGDDEDNSEDEKSGKEGKKGKEINKKGKKGKKKRKKGKKNKEKKGKKEGEEEKEDKKEDKKGDDKDKDHDSEDDHEPGDESRDGQDD